MSVKHALLALLADGPRYGYELKVEFERATGHAWPLNIGQVYSTLQRLERDALIQPDGPPDEEGRQSYLLSDTGKHAVAVWLAAPLDSPAADRDELSMKVLMAVATTVGDALDVVGEQRVAAMSHLQMLTARKATLASAPDAGLAARLHLDRIILVAESQIRWLDLVEQRLEVAGETHQQTSPNARRGASPQHKGTS